MTSYNTTVVVGLQWGDEGKGKITDYLAQDSDYVVRFQGGSNAGHTIYLGEQKHVLHQIPSGILNPDTICMIGNGCVLNVRELEEEIQYLKELNISVEGRLFISKLCHLVTPDHLAQDEENQIKFGSTGKGIGPAYRDRTYRCGTRLGDTTELLEYQTDVSSMLYDAILEEKSVLFEGAQGALLDLDHGTYPHVTSNHTLSSYVAPGTGIPPQMINRVVGVMKGYTTRVGTGPFPTKILRLRTADHIQTIGKEFGATTGRPRIVGWLDLPALKYACRINGVTELAVTKLDVLNGLKTVQVATDYMIDGKWTSRYPYDSSKIGLKRYAQFPGWDVAEEDGELTDNVKFYLKWISDELQLPIKYVGVGENRKSLIV